MLLDTAAKLGRRPLEGTDPLADAGTLHAVLRRELCARFNVDHDEHVRQEEAAFVPFLQRLLQSNRAFRYTVVVAVTAPPRAPLGLSSSPLLGVATQALAAEAQPWSLPTVQGLLGAGHLFANIVQLERTYEMQLRKSSGEFDGRTLTDDRHRGAGASARCLAPRLSRCRLTVRARIARACAAGGGDCAETPRKFTYLPWSPLSLSKSPATRDLTSMFNRAGQFVRQRARLAAGATRPSVAHALGAARDCHVCSSPGEHGGDAADGAVDAGLPRGDRERAGAVAAGPRRPRTSGRTRRNQGLAVGSPCCDTALTLRA